MIKLTPEKAPYYENIPANKIYRALLNQAGTNAPTANEQINTIGTIVWTRDGTGTYIGTVTPALDETKTQLYIQQEDTYGHIAIQFYAGQLLLTKIGLQTGFPTIDNFQNLAITIITH